MKIPDEDDVLHQNVRQARGHPRPLRPGSAQIIDLARVRAERAHLGRPRRAPPTSPRFVLAASLIIGVTIGAGLARLSASSALTQYRNGELLAQGPLARALNEQITGHASPTARIRIVATYRNRSGNYCRTFSIAGSQSLAGLACRERDQWQLQMLLNNAAGTAPALSLELNKNLNGAALTTAAETALRSHDWQ
jgi:hypothetical protein